MDSEAFFRKNRLCASMLKCSIGLGYNKRPKQFDGDGYVGGMIKCLRWVRAEAQATSTFSGHVCSQKKTKTNLDAAVVQGQTVDEKMR